MTFAAESHPTFPADLKEGCHCQADARFVEPSPASGRAADGLVPHTPWAHPSELAAIRPLMADERASHFAATWTRAGAAGP